MGRKIILSHREVDVKVFLEVLAVYAVLALVFTGFYYLEPNITGFAVKDTSQPVKINDSGEIIRTMLSLVLLLIVPLIMYNFILISRQKITKVSENVGKTAEAKKDIKQKRKGKSPLFTRCHNLVLRADNVLKKGNIAGAKKLYSKSRETYIKLEYLEKKEAYDDIMKLYNRLNK